MDVVEGNIVVEGKVEVCRVPIVGKGVERGRRKSRGWKEDREH